jgi:hypothetical protein
MNEGLTRKVRLPIGETEEFEVGRGVAQGAVESPWLYSCFINDLAGELKKRHLGVVIAGVRVPLLMYADDVVMLANGPLELQQMNAVATAFARNNRFRFNGGKSAVMVFSRASAARAEARRKTWTLFGEDVQVKDSYKYLGVDVLNNVNSWSKHMQRAIAKAENTSKELKWLFRSDRGMRPRTAMTLWNALARPQIEYAAEIWAGEITKEMEERAEQVQMNFAKGILGLPARGVSDDFIRAELGIEKLTARWDKLRLGYWHKLQTAKPDRAVAKVLEWRRRRLSRPGGASMGWLQTSQAVFEKYGMATELNDPQSGKNKEEWKRKCYAAVDKKETKEARERLAQMNPDLQLYGSKLKCWDPTPRPYAAYEGEVGRLGGRVVERYLDGWSESLGTKLKQLCRGGLLPTLSRVGRQRGWTEDMQICQMCPQGVRETQRHVLMECDRYQRCRQKADSTGLLAGTTPEMRYAMVLGLRSGDAATDALIDSVSKRMLKEIWNERRALTQSVNEILGRQDLVG